MLRKHTPQNLILVCNASRAFIYLTKEQHPKNPLQLIIELNHAESRQKGLELVSDRPGHYRTDHTTRGAYTANVDPKEHEKDIFAKDIVGYLANSFKNNHFDKLIIISPSHFWGLLEKHLSKNILQSINKIIQKDYTQSTEPELREILCSDK